MPDFHRILQAILAHSIWRVLGVYALSSWLTLLLVQVLTNVAGLPAWFPDLALGLLLVGLPPVLTLAWLRDRSEASESKGDGQGGKAQGGPDPKAGIASPSADRGPPPTRRRRALALGFLVLLGGLGLGWWFLGLPRVWFGGEGTRGPRVAVLPYHFPGVHEDTTEGAEVASGGSGPASSAVVDAPLEALARALHEDLILRLASVPGITPFSSRAMASWNGGDRTDAITRLREAGADVVMRVGLERTEEGYHLSAQLLSARGRERWSRDFPLEDTAPALFRTQSELARQLLAVLRVNPEGGEDSALLVGMPTEDLEAFHMYARGRALQPDHGDGFPEVTGETLLEAERLFFNAVTRDPEFAPAWSALSDTRSRLFRLGAAHGDERAPVHLERAWAAADRALRLDPEDPLARLAVGDLLVRGHEVLRAGSLSHVTLGPSVELMDALLPGGERRAFHEYRRAATSLPGWSPAHRGLGEVARRLGEWDTALSSWERSVELDPGLARTRFELGLTHHLLRQYPRAMARLEEALAMDPGLDVARSTLFHSRLGRWGDLDSAKVALEDLPDPDALPLIRFLGHFYARNFGAAAEVASRLATSTSPASGPVRITAPCSVFTPARMLGTIRAFIGQVEGSRSQLAVARDELTSELSQESRQPRTLAALGEVLALRGDGPEARQFAAEAVGILSVDQDPVEGPACVAALARTKFLTGQTREALDLLEWILAIPGTTSPGELRVDPTWDPLRSDPRFQALLDPDQSGG